MSNQSVSRPRVGENVWFCTSGGDEYYAATITRVREDAVVDLFVMLPSRSYSSTPQLRYADSVRRGKQKGDGGTWCRIGEFEDS